MYNKIVYMKIYAPHNYKNGELILGKYRWIDMIIMIIAFCIFVSVLMLSVFVIEFNIYFIGFFGIVIPLFMMLLVQPFEAYHNFLEYFKLIYKYKIAQKDFTNLINFNLKEKK